MTRFDSYKEALERAQPVGLTGRVSGVRGLSVQVADFPLPIGALCRIDVAGGGVEARVIGFADDRTLVMPMGAMTGIRRGDKVVCTSTEQTIAVGAEMLGRVVDGMGCPIDGRGPLCVERQAPLWPAPIAALQRERIDEPLPTGIRAVDATLTVGRGQRVGVFSGSGVGKSVLLGMVSRYTAADVIVIALIGERGREVWDFIERELGPEGLKRSVVVVATSDEPPLVRVQAAAVACTVAEHFRDRGGDVLLLMDSLTRLATAQRQIGLIAGEPPATKGYTPSVFNLLPELLERSGRTAAGSVTGFYTVLVESDDAADPICDAVRSASDGHIWLSRELGNRGHYPAIDVLQSVSRVMMDVTDESHQAAAGQLRRLLAVYGDIEELLNVGAYQAGANAEYDLAIAMMPEIRRFLSQRITERASFSETTDRMARLVAQITQARQRHEPDETAAVDQAAPAA